LKYTTARHFKIKVLNQNSSYSLKPFLLASYLLYKELSKTFDSPENHIPKMNQSAKGNFIFYSIVNKNHSPFGQI